MSRPPPHRRRHPAVLLVLLLLVSPSAADPDDERCLSSLRQSVTDPAESLRSWNKSTLAFACDGFTSHLQGVTCNNGRVYKLALPGLSLGGALSPFLSNCTNLQSLDLSSNALSGPIPPDLSGLLNLAVLNLSANALSGPIPPDLALCPYLNVIDLHSNRLSGPIPDQLGLLVRLSTFDVSYNRLSGPIPVLLANRTGPAGAAGAPRFNASSFVGNNGLYGYPLPPPPADARPRALRARHRRDRARQRAAQPRVQLLRRLHLAPRHRPRGHHARRGGQDLPPDARLLIRQFTPAATSCNSLCWIFSFKIRSWRSAPPLRDQILEPYPYLFWFLLLLLLQ